MTAKNIEYKKTYYAGQMPIYKISRSSAIALDGLRNEDIYEMLLSIEPMPKYVISFDSFSDDGEIDIQKPIDGERYETLGILDNGIAPIPPVSYTHLDVYKRQGFRRLNRSRNVFPDSKALLKALYLAADNITKKWTNTLRDWGQVYAELSVMYGERLS